MGFSSAVPLSSPWCYLVHDLVYCQRSILQLLPVHRYKQYSSWAKEVASRPAPKNPLAKKAKKTQNKENSQQALVAAIRYRQLCTNLSVSVIRWLDKMAVCIITCRLQLRIKRLASTLVMTGVLLVPAFVDSHVSVCMDACRLCYESLW